MKKPAPETEVQQSKLASYCWQRRQELRMSQAQLSKAAGIGKDTIGRIELGKTTKLSSKTKNGLAQVFGVSIDYLEAKAAGQKDLDDKTLKICPRCWRPGSIPERAWLDPRAKYCFLCGGGLRDACSKCGAKFTDFKHHFCPFCGHPYSASN